MALIEYRLGDLITQRREKNNFYNVPIRGVSRNGFIQPKQIDADTSLYNVFYKYDFVFNPARMELNSIALNVEYDMAICSSLYEIFYIHDPDILLPEYLNLFIKRQEFARRCGYEAVGSARNYFRISDLSEFRILLPKINIQQKVVEVYLAMVANQKVYEKGLDDLKQTYEAYIENLRRKSDKKPIMEYLYESFDRNIGSSTPALGVSIEKKFIEAKRESTSYENYKIVKLNEFAFRPVLDKMDSSFTLALNRTVNCAVSPAYIVFGTNADVLLPQYLMLWLSRKETERWLAFNAWGSARNTIELSDLGRLEIPIPSINIQKDIVDVYEAYEMRKKINVNLKKQINEICPVLIKGSITLNH